MRPLVALLFRRVDDAARQIEEFGRLRIGLEDGSKLSLNLNLFRCFYFTDSQCDVTQSAFMIIGSTFS